MRFKITGQKSGTIPQVYTTDDAGVVVGVAMDYLRQGYGVHVTDTTGQRYPMPLAPIGWREIEAGVEGCSLEGVTR